MQQGILRLVTFALLFFSFLATYGTLREQFLEMCLQVPTVLVTNPP